MCLTTSLGVILTPISALFAPIALIACLPLSLLATIFPPLAPVLSLISAVACSPFFVLLLLVTPIRIEDNVVEIDRTSSSNQNLITTERKICDSKEVEHLLLKFLNTQKSKYHTQNTSLSSDAHNNTLSELTPQEKAINWLVNENNTSIQQCSHYNLIQRYIIAALYYSTNGKNWEEQGNFLSAKDVCTWKGVFCDEENGFVRRLILGKSYFSIDLNRKRLNQVPDYF